MRYFFISQDTKLTETIKFRDFDITGGRMIFTKEESEPLADGAVFYLGGTGKEARPDLIQSPVTMFSGELKDIIDAYEPDLIFKELVLIHKENSLHYSYTQIFMEHLEVLSDRMEYYPNGMPKQLLLDEKKIGFHHMFRLEGPYRKDPVVSLPLAESLLRRKITGICFEEVEVG